MSIYPIEREEAQILIKQKIKEHYKKDYTHLFYENPIAYKSVPDLFHFQIFVHIKEE